MNIPRHHRLFGGSSYDRYLDMLLPMWKNIKKAIPDATLDICYGWNLYLSAYQDNPERMSWKEKIDKLMEQDGITHYGRLNKQELAKVRRKCGIWAYPTYFQEINCITALDTQKDGLVPCVTDFAALKETVQSGVKVEGDIYDPEVQEKFKDELIKLMQDKKRWQAESKKAKEFAQKFTWDKIAKKWAKYL